MKLTAHLGHHISELLTTGPFSTWTASRTVEKDLPTQEVWYEFESRGVEIICDADETIRTIFLHAGVDESLSEIPFNMARQEVLKLFGQPAESGGASKHPVLGESGAWDRFSTEDGTIHIQYRLNVDQIAMITLIRADAVP